MAHAGHRAGHRRCAAASHRRAGRRVWHGAGAAGRREQPSGTDVLEALALRLLRDGLEIATTLTGCATLADMDPAAP